MIALVCCYGLYDEDIRSPIEMQGIKQYWQGVVQHLDVLKYNISAVVISGGYRQYCVSEAQSNLFLYKKTCENTDIDLSKIPVFLQTSSTNLLQSLAFGYLTILEIEKTEDLLIFCDKVREGRVQKVATKLFEGMVENIQVIGVNRADIHSHSTQEHQYNVALPEDLAGEEINILHTLINSCKDRVKG